MAKIFTFIFIAIGLMILFGAAGIPTTSSYVLDSLGFTSPADLVNFQSSAFYLKIVGLMAVLAGVVAIYIGVFGRSLSDMPLTATLATVTLIAFVGDFIAVVGYASASAVWMGWVAFLIMGVYIGGFVFALWDWVRGKD